MNNVTFLFFLCMSTLADASPPISTVPVPGIEKHGDEETLFLLDFVSANVPEELADSFELARPHLFRFEEIRMESKLSRVVMANLLGRLNYAAIQIPTSEHVGFWKKLISDTLPVEQ